MKETSDRMQARNEEVSLSYEAFRPQFDDAGRPLSMGPNNMWMKCFVAAEDADASFKMFMRGRELLGRITDPADQAAMEQLLQEHTKEATEAMNDPKARDAFILADSTNRRLYEIYKIARKHGVTHNELFN